MSKRRRRAFILRTSSFVLFLSLVTCDFSLLIGQSHNTPIANLNNKLYAAAYPGADLCAKVMNAEADLITLFGYSQIADGDVGNTVYNVGVGGVIDATGLVGAQSCANGLTLGTVTIAGTTYMLPVRLMLGVVQLSVSRQITVGHYSSIVGLSGSVIEGVSDGATRLYQASGANIQGGMIAITNNGYDFGDEAALEGLAVDGQQANNTTSTDDGIYIFTGNVTLRHVSVSNFKRHGIYVYSTAVGTQTANFSCCGFLDQIMTTSNGGDGLRIGNTGDWFIENSQFESNSSYGLELINAWATRILHSDVGNNSLIGLVSSGTAGSGCSGFFVTNTEFGQNQQGDISINGWDSVGGGYTNAGICNVIVGNAFQGINSAGIDNTYDAVKIQDSEQNVVAANSFHNFSGAMRYKYGVEVHETLSGREGADYVGGNQADSSFGAASFTSNSANGSTSSWIPDTGVLTGGANGLTLNAGGASQTLTLNSSGNSLQFRINGTQVWGINGAGELFAQADNTYSIGSATANRPASIYAGSRIVPGLNAVDTAGGTGFTTTPNFDLSKGNIHQFFCTTAGSAISPTFSNLTKGQEITFIFVQNSSTACSVTWPLNVHGAMSSASLSTLSSINVQEFVVSNGGSDLYAVSGGSTAVTGGTP